MKCITRDEIQAQIVTSSPENLKGKNSIKNKTLSRFPLSKKKKNPIVIGEFVPFRPIRHACQLSAAWRDRHSREASRARLSNQLHTPSHPPAAADADAGEEKPIPPAEQGGGKNSPITVPTRPLRPQAAAALTRIHRNLHFVFSFPHLSPPRVGWAARRRRGVFVADLLTRINPLIDHGVVGRVGCCQ